LFGRWCCSAAVVGGGVFILVDIEKPSFQAADLTN
jgi:hypothetical protein